uniref:SPOR domain-containing protein n=2 Tax=unclassified Prevotella TaxID=2638335 RepID=A0AB33J218_9BACT
MIKNKFVALLILVMCPFMTMNAQTFLEQLQKKVPGQGTVSVNQSKEIDELVNGSKSQQDVTKAKNTPKPKETKPTEHPTPIAQHNNGDSTKREPVHKETIPTTQKPVVSPQKTTEDDNNELETPTIDMRKKVMVRSYKVNGYRVQAFSGGNSRADKQRAQQIGNAIKMAYPDQPVYVHFYSPRWICRIGNYRSMQEAVHMLQNIRKMGYKQATIVRGKITVQD